MALAQPSQSDVRCSTITGMGHYLPSRIVSNDELARRLGTTSSWIFQRTGVNQRRFADLASESNVKMAFNASRMAMENSGIKADEIDLILYTTQGTDCYSPGNAYFLPTLLGCNKNAVLDIRGQCSGFIQGLSIADSFIKSGQYNTILLVASELNSPFLNLRPENVDVACLFGDAAGAVVIQRGTLGDNRILSTHLHSDGAFHELLAINLPVTLWKDKNGWPQQAMRPAGFEIVMRGPSVFRLACKYFPEAITEALEANNLTTSGIDWFFMHQANSRIIEYVRRALNLDSQKVYSNIGHVGNTVSASIPVALSEAWIEGKLCKGQLICLSAFGSGLSWASAVLTI